jgi:hypothetical protein
MHIRKNLVTGASLASLVIGGLLFAGATVPAFGNSVPDRASQAVAPLTLADAGTLDQVESAFRAAVTDCMTSQGATFSFPPEGQTLARDSGSVPTSSVRKWEAATQPADHGTLRLAAAPVSTADEAKIWGSGGCADKAYASTFDKASKSVPAADLAAYEEALNTLADEIDRLENAVPSSWSRCIQDASGVALEGPHALEPFLESELTVRGAVVTPEGTSLLDVPYVVEAGSPLALNKKAIDDVANLEATIRRAMSTCGAKHDAKVAKQEDKLVRTFLEQHNPTIAAIEGSLK